MRVLWNTWKMIHYKTLKLIMRKRLKDFSVVYFVYTYLKYIFMGKRIYLKLTRCFGRGVVLYLLPCQGSGDAFIVLSRIALYHKKHQGNKPFLLIAINNNAIEIGKLFVDVKIHIVSERAMNALLSFVRFYGEEKVSNVKVMHFDPPYMYTSISANLIEQKQLTFSQMYCVGVFGGMPWKLVINPIIPEEMQKEADSFFETKFLVDGRTVILFPYANTLPLCRKSYWEELANKLSRAGLCVCTNARCEKHSIKGTKRVFLPYGVLLAVAKRAGYLIGVRSGIFDFLAESKSKQYVLYPSQSNMPRCVVSKFYSLNNAGGTSNTEEFFFDDVEAEQVFCDIAESILHSEFEQY